MNTAVLLGNLQSFISPVLAKRKFHVFIKMLYNFNFSNNNFIQLIAKDPCEDLRIA